MDSILAIFSPWADANTGSVCGQENSHVELNINCNIADFNGLNLTRRP